MNGFTKGVCMVRGAATVRLVDTPLCVASVSQQPGRPEERKANAELIAACFTSASRLAEQGYDAIAAMKEFSEIVKMLAIMPEQFKLLVRLAEAPSVKCEGKPMPKWKAVSNEAKCGAEAVSALLARIRPEAPK